MTSLSPGSAERSSPEEPHGPTPADGGLLLGRRARGAVLFGSAALAGLATAGVVWLAAAGVGDYLEQRADRDVDNAVAVLGLAEAASRLAAATPYLEAANTDARRQNGYIGLHQQTQQVTAMIDDVGRTGIDRTAVDGLRRLVIGMDANLEDLNHLVDRRIALDDELRGALDRLPERYAAYRGVLATVSELALRALREPDTAPLPGADLLRLRDALDDLGRGLVDQLFAAAGVTQVPHLAERQKEFRKAAGRLSDLLDRLPIDAASARRAEAARQLIALGVDAGNLFDVRRDQLRLADAIADVTRNSRDRAADLAQLARRTAARLRQEAAEARGSAAGTLGRAPALSGLGAALAVLAGGALAAVARRSPPPAGAPHPHRSPLLDEDADGDDGPLPPLRILMAEDERITQIVGTAMLKREGHHVTVVADGRRAVEAVAAGAFDLVLMDLRMPEMDGIEAVRRIRALDDPRKARVRIVALTASAITDDIDLCRAAGADAVLPKPLQMATLQPVLANLFSGVELPPPPEPAAPEPATGIATGAATEIAISQAEAAPVHSEASIRQMREALPASRVAQLIDGTLAAFAEHRTTLDDAWRVGDRKAVGAVAHRLAGVAGVYGCMALRAEAQALERAAEATDGRAQAASAAEITARVAAVQTAMQPARRALEAQRASLLNASLLDAVQDTTGAPAG